MPETEDIVTRLERDVLWLERRSIAVLPNDLREAATTIATLRAEVGGLRADAERYRWLRKWADDETASASTGKVHAIIPSGRGCKPAMSSKELDAAIDAAKAG